MQRVISALPTEFAAAIFVAIHTAAEGPRLLAEIFGRMSSLPVVYASNEELIRKSHIYLAPPDRHLLLEGKRMKVTVGPRENRHRPAIDPLFRSAARSYGARAIGILFSGLLDDGSAGLKAITGHGGVSMVQDPNEARFAAMPRNAVRNDSPQYVLPAEQIAPTLIALVNERAGLNKEEGQGSELDNEVKIAAVDMSSIERDKAGAPSVYSCPECNGILWEMREGEILRFRCRVGHAFGAESLLVSKKEELEGALWAALRALEERAALHRRLSEHAAIGHNPRAANQFRQSAADLQQQAQTIRTLLLEGEHSPLTGTDD